MALTAINVESPACGARSKTTIVRKPPMEQVVSYRYYEVVDTAKGRDKT